jgi:hypothetical protein
MHKAVTFGGVLALALGMASCVSDPYREPLTAQARQELGNVAANAGRMDSSIVVRVAKDGSHCPSGQVRLRPLRNGLPDPQRFVTVGQVNALVDMPYAEAFARSTVKMLTFDVSGLWKDASVKDARVAFVAIEPGEYLVTWVNCSNGDRKEWMGDDHPNAVASGRYSPPVLGANLIRIRPGEIVDAGILEIRTTRTAGFLTRATARVVAHPTPEPLKEAFKEAAPDVYRRMTFTSFEEWVLPSMSQSGTASPPRP